MRIDGRMKLSVIETGSIRKSKEETSRALLACAPGKGFETGDVRRWTNSHNGAVIVYEIFCMMSPTSPMLLQTSIIDTSWH
jgi:hypothetical protein